jgi:multiple sugar transport system substrate-binding protein
MLQVLFDIMAGLERRVDPFTGLNQPMKRFLTLLYGITISLALILGITAVLLSSTDAPAAQIITETALSPTEIPTQNSHATSATIQPTEIAEIPPTPNEVTPSSLGVTSADLTGKQVTVWQPWSGETGAALKAILDEYSRTNQWGITVNVESYEGFGRLDEAVESAIISGTLPDLVIDYGYQGQHWDGSGIIMDLTPYVEDPLWGYTSGEVADFYPGFWSEDMVGGGRTGGTRRLGIPFYRSGYVIFYNQSWAEELGFTKPPSNMQEFKSQACESVVLAAATSVSTDTHKGGWLITSQPGEAAGWIYAFGGEISNPQASGYLFDTTETRQAFTYLKGLVDNGCAWSDPNIDTQSEFANRGALFMVGSLFDIPAQQQAFTKAANQDQWTVIPFPSSRQPIVDSYGPSIMVLASTPAKQLAAWLVTKWLVFPHNQISWVERIDAYPTRQSAANFLIENPGVNPQWNQALELLPDAKSEPSQVSWSVVRWALSDAMAELLDPQTSSDQIPAILSRLTSTAEEISNQAH